MTKGTVDEGEAPTLVLVVDDDPDSLAIIRRRLELAGFRTEGLASAEALLEALSRVLPDVICLDLGLPGLGGMDALAVVRKRHQTVPVVIVTAESSVETAVQAMQSGAYDYVTKPVDSVQLVRAVQKASEHHQLCSRVAELERDVSDQQLSGIVGRSPVMRAMFRQLQKVVTSDITVLIQGESGTGKEMIAGALHRDSPRSSGPFIAVNCAAIPETLQDSEFFGHERGAFTGALQTKAGRFEQANGGTLFLDEVGELSLSLQAKLLRVLQERQYQRVGGTKTLKSDFRLVAATHRDLRNMISEGLFREDLFYRIAVFELELPALRHRHGDLPLLVHTMLSSLATEGLVAEASPAVLECFEQYAWPGNVRELRNILERALVVCDSGQVQLDDLPRHLLETANQESAPNPSNRVVLPFDEARIAPAESTAPQSMTLAQLERWAIETHMRRTNGDIAKVVSALGIGRTTLYRRLKEYRLD